MKKITNSDYPCTWGYMHISLINVTKYEASFYTCFAENGLSLVCDGRHPYNMSHLQYPAFI